MADTPDGEPPLLGSEAYNNIREQWNTFLEAPGGRAALLQAGLTLMGGPTTWGGGPLRQFSEAIGSAGEAVGRQEKMDIAQLEAQSKADVRAAQAGAAESRAETARMGLGLTQQKLDIQKMDVESKIQYRQAQDEARKLREESSRIRAEAAKTTSETGKANLELRARQLDIQAQDVESKAQRRMEATDIARQQLEQRGTAQGQRAEQSDLQLRARYSIERQKLEASNKLLGIKQTIPTYDEWLTTQGFPSRAPGVQQQPPQPQQTREPVRVNTPEEAAALAPGTPYITPDGKRYVR